jgi:hypothetical protein
MIQLPSCSSCGGFVGLALNACPHCGAQLSRARALAVGMVAAVAGGAVSMTLMACYGMSCADANCGELPDASGDASDGGKDSATNDAALDAASDATTDAMTDATTTDASGDAGSDAATDAAAD